MYGTSFNKCSACSDIVSATFKEDKLGFLLKACNEQNYLEDLTGITKMNEAINFADIESLGSDISI